MLIRRVRTRVRLIALAASVLACFYSQWGGAGAAEVILYLVDELDPAGGTAAGATVSRAGGEAVPLRVAAVLRLGDRLRIVPPTLRVRLCGVHNVVLGRGDYEILNGGAIRQRQGQLAYDSRPCAGKSNTPGERVFELLFGEGSESVPLGVLGTRFLAEARANSGTIGAPGLAGAGLASLRVIVGEGEVVLGRPGSGFYRSVARGRALVYSAGGAAERAAAAVELAELDGLLGTVAAPAIPVESPHEPADLPSGKAAGAAAPVPPPNLQNGSDSLTHGSGGASRMPLVRRPWFWGVLGAAAVTLTAGGIALAVICTRGVPEPTLGRIGGP